LQLVADRRVELDARPAPAVTPVVEAVFLGHCPPEDRPAQWDRLGNDPALLEEVASLGFRTEAEQLRDWAARLTAGEIGLDGPRGPENEALAGLFGLPVPVYSLGQYQDLFPGAFEAETRYESRLAGKRAWLPSAVQDFFASGERLANGAKKLWVIRVREAEGRRAFLPTPHAALLEVRDLAPFERALLIPRAGILALPDLERLQVPAELPDIPRLQLVNEVPEFLPCAAPPDATHRERRRSSEMSGEDRPLPVDTVVPGIVRALARHRPDLQCLLAVPFGSAPQGEVPRPSPAFLEGLVRMAGGGGYMELAGKLRHLQFLYPYLRAPDRRLGSPAGLVAGAQVAVSQRLGPWRSAAGRPLSDRVLPYPPVTQQQAAAWRDTPGISILLERKGRTVLDDERLAGSVLYPDDARRLPPDRRDEEHLRSAEIMRFLGWLRRELQTLGERLAFDVDPRDPRPELALRSFFDHLHRLGALRGARPERAYDLRKRTEGESTLIFEIELAPAFPIDLIRVTFVHNRHADGGSTRVEVAGG